MWLDDGPIAPQDCETQELPPHEPAEGGDAVNTYWAIGGAALLLGAVIAAAWFFFGTGPGEEPDHEKIMGYRAYKAQ